MIAPTYHISSEMLCLVSAISEQIGILKSLTSREPKTPELSYNPFSEDDLQRAQEKFATGLSQGVGRYNTADQHARLHMALLFDWLINSQEHPLVKSCIFHYELIAIHPFSEGNERLALYWQSLLLAQWQPLLAGLPLETVVIERQQEYRRILAYHGEMAKITHFVEFILQCLLDITLQEVKNKTENKARERSREKAPSSTADNSLPEGAEALLTKSEQRIVKLLVADPHITIGILAHRLQLSEAGINKALANLRKKKVIERIGANKNGSWKVNL